MPNGASKNLVRLTTASAAYRKRCDEWAEVRVPPIIVWDFPQILDSDNFDLLATRLPIRTSSDITRFSVGGARGVVWYDDLDHISFEAHDVEAARRWLGVEMRVDEYPGM
jgi:hypothetical protein